MKILIIAGEASGDLHGSKLADSILKNNKDIKLFGVGGDLMQKAGVSLYFDIEHTAVVGAVEIFSKIFFFKKLYTFIRDRINEGIFDAVILIDYPTLNMRLAKIAKDRNIPVFYFISPQVWAWRKGRVSKVKRNITEMMVILPFEKDFYAKEGVEVSFVGHPFVDIVKPKMSKAEAIKTFSLSEKQKIIGIFPGSRNHEVSSLIDEILKTCKLLKKEMPDVQFILALADSVDETIIDSKILKCGFDIKIVKGYNYDCMNVSDFLICASGSTTLEASFFSVPMIIIYKVNFITYHLSRWLVSIKRMGLVNIVADETIVPELLQHDANADRISKEIISIMRDKKRYNYIQKRLLEVSKSLGKGGAINRVSDIVLGYFDKNKKD